MSNSFIYPLIMFIAGFGIPVMAALNSSLGIKLGSSVLATTILFLVGLLVSSIYLLQAKGLSITLNRNDIPWYLYLGGSLVAFYILSVTWVSPRFGIGNAISFVLLGQLAAICLIDHFGLFGAKQSTLDLIRISGITLMSLGVFLVLKRS